MPAPDLTPQTPGDPLANAISTATAITGNPDANEQATANAQAPAVPDFTAKHNGGGRWVVADADGAKVGDFTGTKDEALAEAERLNAGGEPLILDPQRTSEVKAPAQPSTVDATAIKQPVMTAEGWLCPEPPVKE